MIELVGIDLPPEATTWMLLDIFERSVHWFMLVFHEPSLRKEAASILQTSRSPVRRLSNIVLILVALLIATKYVAEEDMKTAHESLDVTLLQSELLAAVESKFLAILDQENVGAIQVCILLSSFYFYHGRPNRCLAINSAAVRIAKSLKFHREDTWQGIDTIEREQRRRVWWALYVLDGLVHSSNNRLSLLMLF